MNLYQVKLKVAEDAATAKTYDVLADDVLEAATKAMKIHRTRGGGFVNPGNEAHRVVMVAEKARGIE